MVVFLFAIRDQIAQTYENLGKVNLILGPNNAGKTSILEAVYIHACHGNIKLIFDVLLFLVK